jgi:hypothetical protein
VRSYEPSGYPRFIEVWADSLPPITTEPLSPTRIGWGTTTTAISLIRVSMNMARTHLWNMLSGTKSWTFVSHMSFKLELKQRTVQESVTTIITCSLDSPCLYGIRYPLANAMGFLPVGIFTTGRRLASA